MTRSREIVGLLLDSDETIRRVRVVDPGPLASPVGILTGRRISEVFDQRICELFVARSYESVAAGKVQRAGVVSLSQDDFSTRLFVTVWRSCHDGLPARFFSVYFHRASASALTRATRNEQDTSGGRLSAISREVDEAENPKEKLHEYELLLAQAEGLAHLGRWELDIRTGQTLWSRPFFRKLGFLPNERANQQAYWENVHESDRARNRESLAAAIETGKPCEYVSRYRFPSGEWRLHRTKVVPLLGASGKVVRAVGLVQDITDQTRAEEELHRLSQRLMCARDEERRNLARGLHESAGQTLAALKMSLRNLQQAVPKKNRTANAILGECFDLAAETVRQVRTVSYLMHPPLLDEAGLASALRWYAKGFSDRSKIHVVFEAPENFGRLPGEIETTLFRIVQEALTNVYRHSGSRIARVRLTRYPECAQAEVEDEGYGFEPQLSGGPIKDGVGIAGMRERVSRLNGAFEIQSAPGRGTVIRATLPTRIPEAEPDNDLGAICRTKPDSAERQE